MTRKAMGEGKHCSEALSSVRPGPFVACSIASIGPLSGLTQACRMVLSWHQISRPITVITTLER